MDNEARIAKLKEKEYRKIFGVTKPIFEQMLEILEKTFQDCIGNQSRRRCCEWLICARGMYLQMYHALSVPQCKADVERILRSASQSGRSAL